MASAAQSSLNPGVMYGNQTFFASQFNNMSSRLQQILGGYGSVFGVVVYTMFTIFLFNTIIPENEENVSEDKFRIASYILSALGALLTAIGIFSTFRSGKLGLLLGLGFFAFIGYIVYYAFKNPDQGFFTFDNFVTSMSILVSFLVFFLAFRSNPDGPFNVMFQRIKTMILFFCFIALIIEYKVAAPGDIISKFSGSLYGMTISLAVFLFVYLAILMVTPVVNPAGENQGTGAGLQNLLDVFSKTTWYFVAALVVFLVAVTIGFSVNTDALLKNKEYGWALIASVVASILFGIFIIWPKTPEFTKNFVDVKDTINYQRSALIVLAVAILTVLIVWISSVTNLFQEGGETKTSSAVLNLALLFVVLAFVYKVAIVEYPQLNGVTSWIFDIIFYIPCLISKGIDLALTTYFGSAKGTIPLLLILTFILIVYGYSQKSQYSLQFLFGGGKLLIDDSISLRNRTIAATYSDLNAANEFNYRYAISLWAFIDAMPPNTNENYNKYASIMSYGGKPDILYNPSKNEAIVTMKLKNADPSSFEVLNVNETTFDENYLAENESIVIVERIPRLPLQKWNNFIVNSDGGTMDVFLNNELVASKIKMVPYMTYDNLTVGQDNGLFGGLYKVIYHEQPMNINQIRLSYESIVNAIRIP
jgi:hypothetical protein